MLSIPLLSPFTNISNCLDAERYHTSLVIGSAMRFLYSIMIPVMRFRMAWMYLLLDVSDKGYTLLCLGISIVLNCSLTMIYFTASAVNIFGNMCVLGCRFQSSIWIWGIIYSCTSFTLVSYTDLRNITIGGGSLTLGILVVLGSDDVGSVVLFLVASENIADGFLSAFKVFSFKGVKGCVGWIL